MVHNTCMMYMTHDNTNMLQLLHINLTTQHGLINQQSHCEPDHISTVNVLSYCTLNALFNEVPLKPSKNFCNQ